jgi:hypothetical protein
MSLSAGKRSLAHTFTTKKFVSPLWAPPQRPTSNHGRELRAKLRATNAQTPPKTAEHQRPESKTNQQDREPDEICNTSIPGSNPGGASKNPWQFRRLSFARTLRIDRLEHIWSLWFCAPERRRLRHSSGCRSRPGAPAELSSPTFGMLRWDACVRTRETEPSSSRANTAAATSHRTALQA